MRLQRFEGNPILSPIPAHDWESFVTTNPGAWYDLETGKVMLLYRAAGQDPEHKIYFGLAVSQDGYHFERFLDQPVFKPSDDGFDAGCVEDARMVKIGEWYYITYATRPFPPGEYWKSDGQAYRPPFAPSNFPRALRDNKTATGLALTKDFRSWIRAGRITSPVVDDRDVILFPEKIQERYWMLHRPLSWTGPGFEARHPAIWISSSEDLLDWHNSKLLARAEFAWEYQKIGGNTPPIRTDYGWLTLYHAVGQDRHYRLGAMLLDLDNPGIVRYRTRDWLLQPEAWYELDGLYPGVCFPCGKVLLGDTLFVYYGGADKYVCLATCLLEELLSYLLECPVER